MTKSRGIYSRRHGHGNPPISPEYNAWRSMKRRCLNITDKEYKNYGGRGVTICEAWRDFNNFLADMGYRPSPSHSLERIDNDGNYEPSNCKWGTKHEQSNNRRFARRITFNDQTLTIAEWAQKTGLPYTCVRQRLRSGWGPVAILTTPLLGKNRKPATT